MEKTHKKDKKATTTKQTNEQINGQKDVYIYK